MRRKSISLILIVLAGLWMFADTASGQHLQVDHRAVSTNPGTTSQEYGADAEPQTVSRFRSGRSIDLAMPSKKQAAKRVLPPPEFSSKSTPHPARTGDHRASDRSTVSATNSLWKPFVAVICILVLAIVVARILKKHGPVAIVGLPEEAIEILGKRPIDRQQTIHLVRCGSRVLVLGTSINGIHTLAEITDPVEVDFLAGICRRKSNETGMTQTFRHLFRKQAPSVPQTHSQKTAVKLAVDEPFTAPASNDLPRQMVPN